MAYHVGKVQWTLQQRLTCILRSCDRAS